MTVNDPAENEWLLSTFGVGHDLWIGLNDVDHAGLFTWASGETVAFTNWHPGEPNNAVGGESFVELLGNGNGKWNDLPNDFPGVKVNGLVEIGPSRTSCVASPPGLIGWWPGDENASDLAGGNSGVLVNTTFATGLIGHAFAFTGQNSYVQVPNNPALAAITNTFTLEAWVWHEPGGGAYQCYLTISPENAVIKSANGYFDFLLAFEGGAIVNLTSTNRVENHTWYHVVATYDGSAQRLYVNGKLAGVAVPNRAVLFRSYGDLYISLAGQTMNGLVDEPAVYNRALSTAEIESHFAAGAAGMCKLTQFTDIQVFFPGTVRLGIKGPPSKALQVQTSTNLVGWSVLTTVTNFNGKAQVSDTAAGLFAKRFYRAQQVP